MDTNRRPVVVGVDGSPAGSGAVRWAADEAVRLRRPLRIAHALEAPDPAREDIDEQRLTLDAAAEARQWQPGLEVTTATRRGSAAAVLLEHSRHAALVVVGGRGIGGFPSLRLGSVGIHLAAHAPCPVLVIHHAERWAGPESVLPAHGPVVVGADGSDAGEAALQLAFQEAALRQAPVRAVRAWQCPPRRFGRSADPDRACAAVLGDLATSLEPWRAKYPNVEVEPRAVEGRPAPVLLAEAAGALLVVVGARGRGGFEDLRLGGTAWQVLQHADAPVLVARRQ
ncbi:universal stress protein [Dactylosporangium sp. CA-092794]|uniref:universal stress protein n=1 Tax=Dactylosporangium sp. CA-092794 TaxID=3239929 RepID=UPI003D8F6C8D